MNTSILLNLVYGRFDFNKKEINQDAPWELRRGGYDLTRLQMRHKGGKWRALSALLEMPFGSLRVIADRCSFVIDCFNTGKRGEGQLLYHDAVVKCCLDATLNAASKKKHIHKYARGHLGRSADVSPSRRKFDRPNSLSPLTNCQASLTHTFGNVKKSLKEN